MAGSSAANLPVQDDWIVRKFEELDQWRRELQPSVAKTVTDIVRTQSITEAYNDIDSIAEINPASPGPALTVCSRELVTPEGYDIANIICVGSVKAKNGGPASPTDYLLAQLHVAGDYTQGLVQAAGDEDAFLVLANAQAVSVSPTGDTVDVRVDAYNGTSAAGVWGPGIYGTLTILVTYSKV